MTRETAQRAAELEDQIAETEEAIRIASHPKKEMDISLRIPYDSANPDDEDYWCTDELLSTEARVEIASIIIRDLSAQRALAEAELLKL